MSEKSSSRELNRRSFLTLAALVGTAATIAGCGTNEANAGAPEAPTTTTTVENEEKSVSVAELDGSERVPYTYSVVYSEEERHMVWGPGTPIEFKGVDTIEDLVGTEDEIAEKFKIPAGLSDEEFANKMVGSLNYVKRLSRESNEEYNLLPLSFVPEIIYSEGDYSDTNEVYNAFGKHYHDASSVLFADDATEAAREWRQLAFYNNAYNTILAGATTDNKKEGVNGDIEMFRNWNELEGVISSEPKQDGGRYITIRYRAFNNSDTNSVIVDSHGNMDIDTTAPQTDTDTPYEIAYHEITFATSITDDGREVIEDVDDTFINDD